MRNNPSACACFFFAFTSLAVQRACFKLIGPLFLFFLVLLGQPPVAKPSHRDIVLHVKVAQIDYPYSCDI